MANFLMIAFKNIFRNKRRTLITLLVISFGAVALILAGGFIGYSFEGLRETTIHRELGHLQLYNSRFFEQEEDYPLQFGLSATDTLTREILQLEHVRFTLARIQFMGLISNGEKSVAFLGKGVEPDKEAKLSSFAMEIREGYFLGEGPHQTMDEVVVGYSLAKSLKAKLGDYLTLMTTTADGALNAMDFRMVGTLSTGIPEYDQRLLMIPLHAAQLLLNSQKVGKLVVVLDETDFTDEVASQIRAKFPDLTVKTWLDLATFYKAVVGLYNSIFGFLGVIIVIIAILSSANTMMMAVLERTREIGTLMAVGTSRGRMLLNFIYEGLLLGIVGGFVGVMVSLILIQFINHAGIQMPPPPGSTSGYPLYVNTEIPVIVATFFLMVGTSVLSAFFPALKAARLKIVDALGHI